MPLSLRCWREIREGPVRVGVALLTALSLVACGSDAQDVSTVDELAGAIDCTNLEVGSEEIFVREGGTCDADGESVGIYTFNSGDSQSNWLDIAREFGGVYVVGDNWIVSTESESTAQDIQERIGGDIE